MTFASAIRFAAPLLLTATLAGCAVPYDDAPYYGGTYSSGDGYGGSYYNWPYYGGNGYAVVPDRHRRAHRRNGGRDLRHHRRAPEQQGVKERHRRDRAERRRDERRVITDRAADRRRLERAAERQARRAERQAHERAPAPRLYDDRRGSGETGAVFTRRIERAGRRTRGP